jgi:hypothetical protein
VLTESEEEMGSDTGNMIELPGSSLDYFTTGGTTMRLFTDVFRENDFGEDDLGLD